MKSQLIIKTMVCAIALATGCVAQATPFAYADIAFTNLTFTGLDSPGVTVSGGGVVTSSSANYGDAPGVSLSQNGSLTLGSDTKQAQAGPTTTTAENTFSRQLETSFGTRGDALITGNLITGIQPLTVDAVSEGHLLSAPNATSAASTGGTSTGFSFNFETSGDTTFGLGFSASEILHALTTQAGDFASAQVSSSFSISKIISPSERSVVFFVAPAELQGGLTLSTVDSATIQHSLNFSQSILLGAGRYEFSFLTGTQERLQAEVPEPEPLALLGVGMLGFAVARRRKNATGR